MRRYVRAALCLLAWGITLLIGGCEAALVWLWRQGTQYVAQFGAAENPYAAEEAADAGLFAVLLLPLFALALCGAIYGTGRWKDDWKKRAGRAPGEER